MSARAATLLAAGAGALLLASACGAPFAPRPAPPAAPAIKPLESPAQAAAQCLRSPVLSERTTCVGAWLDRNPGGSLSVAGQLLLRAPAEDTAPDLALTALRRAPEGPEKADLLLSVADAALAARRMQVADEALRALEAGAAPSAEPGFAEAVSSRRAALLAEQGRWAEAYAIHERTALAEPRAVEPVGDAVRALVRAGEGNRVAAFCGKLFADGDPQRTRPLQTLACVREAAAATAMPPDEIERLALRTLAQIPGLRPDDLARLAPPSLSVADAGSRCAPGKLMQPSSVLVLGEIPLDRDEEGGSGARRPDAGGLASAVYTRLAESEPDDKRKQCFLGLAAKSCMATLGRNPPCAEQRSIGLYLQMTARVDEVLLERAVHSIFVSKRNLYDRLYSRPGDSVKRSLFELHLSLAYLFADRPGWASKGPAYTVWYHVTQADKLWTSLHPKSPFPEELLDASMKRHLRRRSPPAPRPGDRAP